MLTHLLRLMTVAMLFAAVPLRAADAPPLPVTKIVLFNSGVGYFQRDAKIQGTQVVDLQFPAGNINDLLKSLVVQDFGGGSVSTVNYGSQDPITKTLRSFAIDLTTNPSLFDLLSQVRGEQVAVETPSQVAGTIVGLERRKQVTDKEAVEIEYLTLLTEEGIRSFPLATLNKIKLSNAKLDGELRQALKVLALGHANDKKTVSINFQGQGAREVLVGYVQESPIWKTSYRLVLRDNDPILLQGWAIVENTSDEDWKQVALTLVSGRPISFVMNMYQPLYVPRPWVEPELFASLRPQTYGQDMDRANLEFAKRDESNRSRELAATDALRKSADMKAAAAPMAAARRLEQANGLAAGFGGGNADKLAEKEQQMLRGVQSVAQGGNVGEYFQYKIDTPVTLPRQQSAMLPIVNASIKGEKVSIYNPAVQPKHPLSGLRMTNTSGLHLMQGPITVFDDGAYAGDARIEDLTPNSERLLSYALDLDTEVAIEGKGVPEQLVSVKLAKGTLQVSRRMERHQLYTVKNSGRKVKTVLIEQPLQPNWKLIEPAKSDEKTRDLYRFAVQAEPGKPALLTVREEQTVYQSYAANNLDDGTVSFYISAQSVSPAVKKALGEIVSQKRRIEQLLNQQKGLQAELQTIDQEQARIRQNMQQLDRNSDLYARYVKKFSEQEDQVERLRKQVNELQADILAKKKDLDTFVLALEVQ